MRFLLVDRITSLESGKRATALKNVSLTEDFFEYHFPEHPIMPGVLITESMVQLADWLLREQRDFESVGLPSGFDSVKFHHLVRPGDQLIVEVELVGNENATYQFTGQAKREKQVVTSARFSMHLRPAEELQRPTDSRRLFQIICGH
jgi:3-hydroxymyristoyl/3-hydroxydecanoyl-(acyl carrier protein) dehydratase